VTGGTIQFVCTFPVYVAYVEQLDSTFYFLNFASINWLFISARCQGLDAAAAAAGRLRQGTASLQAAVLRVMLIAG